MTYTIEQLSYTTQEGKDRSVKLAEQIFKVGWKVEELFGKKMKMDNFDFSHYIRNNRFMLCMCAEELVGVMLSSLHTSLFDEKIKILQQDLLWAKPGTRAAKLLMDDFIDFGKRNANHLISMITPVTNIKPRSLERLGFKVMETLYRLEV